AACSADNRTTPKYPISKRRCYRPSAISGTRRRFGASGLLRDRSALEPDLQARSVLAGDAVLHDVAGARAQVHRATVVRELPARCTVARRILGELGDRAAAVLEPDADRAPDP